MTLGGVGRADLLSRRVRVVVMGERVCVCLYTWHHENKPEGASLGGGARACVHVEKNWEGGMSGGMKINRTGSLAGP